MKEMNTKYIYIGYFKLFNREGFSPLNEIKIYKTKIINEVYYKGYKEYQLEKPFSLTLSNHINCLVERDLDKGQLILDASDLYLSFYFSFDKKNTEDFIKSEIERQKRICINQINKYKQRLDAFNNYNYINEEI